MQTAKRFRLTDTKQIDAVYEVRPFDGAVRSAVTKEAQAIAAPVESPVILACGLDGGLIETVSRRFRTITLANAAQARACGDRHL